MIIQSGKEKPDCVEIPHQENTKKKGGLGGE